MIRTAYNSRLRVHKASGSQGREQRRGGYEAEPRRDGGTRRASSNVVHPWMSLPEKLALAQAAMRELAGKAAFQCPLGNSLFPGASAPVPEEKPKSATVNVIVRKRRFPTRAIPPALTTAG